MEEYSEIIKAIMFTFIIVRNAVNAALFEQWCLVELRSRFCAAGPPADEAGAELSAGGQKRRGFIVTLTSRC